jgi:hypothetical protein
MFSMLLAVTLESFVLAEHLILSCSGVPVLSTAFGTIEWQSYPELVDVIAPKIPTVTRSNVRVSALVFCVGTG